MHFVYMDESGDDGDNNSASPLFCLSAFYFPKDAWRENYEYLRRFRRYLNAVDGIPLKMEMHTREFILNKRPYNLLDIPSERRIEILDEYCATVAQLCGRIVNVVIHKRIIKTLDYDVCGTAFRYCVQRVENDMRKTMGADNYIMIVDQGRLPKMTKTARKMQAINYIPSMFGPWAYRNDIKLLLEDPLSKDSKQSYFIQLADFLARLVYMHKAVQLGYPLPSRTPAAIDAAKLESWLTILSPVLNLQAHAKDKFGIVCYPK